jgi:hypothetical protein
MEPWFARARVTRIRAPKTTLRNAPEPRKIIDDRGILGALTSIRGAVTTNFTVVKPFGCLMPRSKLARLGSVWRIEKA